MNNQQTGKFRLSARLALWGWALGLAAGAVPAATTQTLEEAHRAALAEANAAVERAIPAAESDPLRPIFHVKTAARFINDPNGPVYFNGQYHVFFQHLAFWGEQEHLKPMWGHASSPDLIHWQHQPIALAPNPGSYDAGGIASGCCVIHNGVPTIIYTGFAEKQVQCLATSSDNMVTWQKDPANPVITELPKIEGLDGGFRDPCAWKEADGWRLLLGSGYKESKGGTVLLYRSADLRHWEYLGPLCEGMDKDCFQWECPSFFGLGDRHVLIVSPLFRSVDGLQSAVMYSTGRYRDNRFEPGPWRPIDLGGAPVLYAPNTFEDPKGRRILWGWLKMGRPVEAGWSNCLTLPRVMTLAADGTLRFEPAEELIALRRNERTQRGLTLTAGQVQVLEPALGLHGEILLEVDPGAAQRVELRVGCAADGSGGIPFAYDAAAGKLIFGDKTGEFKLAPDEKTLRVRLFVDGVVGEAYVNERACFSNALPVSEGATGVALRATGGTAQVKRASLWAMDSIWSAPAKP